MNVSNIDNPQAQSGRPTPPDF